VKKNLHVKVVLVIVFVCSIPTYTKLQTGTKQNKPSSRPTFQEAMARRSLLHLALSAAVLLLALSAAGAAAAGDAPFVVAHKSVKLSRPGPGVERLAVTLDLYNQGSA
jgi:hypothetical protein